MNKEIYEDDEVDKIIEEEVEEKRIEIKNNLYTEKEIEIEKNFKEIDEEYSKNEDKNFMKTIEKAKIKLGLNIIPKYIYGREDEITEIYSTIKSSVLTNNVSIFFNIRDKLCIYQEEQVILKIKKELEKLYVPNTLFHK
jgi:hypothetical protein